MNEQKMNVRDARREVFNSIGKLRRKVALISYLMDEKSDTYETARSCMGTLEYLGNMVCDLSFKEEEEDRLLKGLSDISEMIKEIDEVIIEKFGDDNKILEMMA